MSAPTRSAADARVLIVEDEPRFRELVLKAVTGWGFRAVGARNGEESLRLNELDPFDIAVLDLNLPGIDGLDALRGLRARAPNLQAVILTGFAAIESARQAVHLDVVEFLTKPCHLGELERALDRALRRTRPLSVTVNESAADESAGLTLDEIERRHILQALRRNGGNRAAAARELGISRRSLYYRLEDYQRRGLADE